jgi:predicted nucleotidyltransferase
MVKAKKKILSEETLQEIVRRIVAAVRPEKIILFGSAAREEMGPDSDLDLLVIKSCRKPVGDCAGHPAQADRNRNSEGRYCGYARRY